MKLKLIIIAITGGILNFILGSINNHIGAPLYSVLAFYLVSGLTEVHGIYNLVMGLLMTGQSFFTAVFWAGMISNIIDKLFSSILTYCIVKSFFLNSLLPESI